MKYSLKFLSFQRANEEVLDLTQNKPKSHQFPIKFKKLDKFFTDLCTDYGKIDIFETLKSLTQDESSEVGSRRLNELNQLTRLRGFSRRGKVFKSLLKHLLKSDFTSTIFDNGLEHAQIQGSKDKARVSTRFTRITKIVQFYENY